MKTELLARRLAEITHSAYENELLIVNDLAKKYQVSTKTIYRDLERLSFILIKCTDTGHFKLNPEKKLMFTHHDLIDLVEKLGIKNMFPIKAIGFIRNLLLDRNIDCYHFNQSPIEIEVMPHHSLFEKAIKNRNRVEFLYKEKLKNVQPYLMIYNRGCWYLSAIRNDEIKIYSFAKIRFVKIKNEHFFYEQHIANKIKSHKSIWFTDEKIEVLLHIMPEISFYFKRKLLFPNQKIVKRNNDDSLLISSTVSSYAEIMPKIQCWIPNISIISPSEINILIQNNLRKWLDTAEVKY